MRGVGSVVLVLGIVLAALLAAVTSMGTRAQGAGVTFEPVAGSASPPLIAAKAGIRLDWARFAPDASYTAPADNPSLLVVAVESGSLTVRSSTPLVINRAVIDGAGEAMTTEQVAAETETTLGPGDSFVRPPNSAQEFHNSGEEPAVALTASVSTEFAAGNASGAGTPVAAQPGGLVVALAVVSVPQCPAGYIPAEIAPVATPGGGGGGGGAGGVAVAIAAAPECVGSRAGHDAMPSGTPTP
jgi:hypothetical protein